MAHTRFATINDCLEQSCNKVFSGDTSLNSEALEAWNATKL
jgi:hypothetical protein